MDRMSGRRKNSVVVEAMKNANKLVLMCQELMENNYQSPESDRDGDCAEYDSDESDSTDEFTLASDTISKMSSMNLTDSQSVSSAQSNHVSERAKGNWRKISQQLQANYYARVWDGEAQDICPESSAWFLGPKAENLELFKELVTHALDEHAEFRQYKYFPLDPQYIDSNTKKQKSYKKALEKLRTELDVLSERLKNSVPFFNFRSQGHMLWDTTLASNLGYIAALLYNQNNVASMASSVTLQLEREASVDLCRMAGYKVEGSHHTSSPMSWGHLPNGGTVANIEAMWAARCLKYNALAMQMMMKEKFHESPLSDIWNSFSFRKLDGSDKLLKDGTPWELLNIPVDYAIDLFDSLLDRIKETTDLDMSFDDLFGMLKEYTMEHLGVLDFFEGIRDSYPNPRMGKWFVPGSRHYSWDKGNNILGMGRNNLVKVSVDASCRMDLTRLREYLQECLDENVPVIGVTAVFGTTQEGTVDDLNEILKIREEFEAMEDGLTFYIHIDGAWGGYFAATMWNSYNEEKAPDGTPVPGSEWHDQTFPTCRLSRHFENQLRAIRHSNSITLDPHKTGFCPYPAGGLLYRNGNIRKFLAQTAAYVNHGDKDNEEINLFGIDGSKPGAASAGVWLSHRVIGLHDAGYGLILRQCNFSAGVMYSMWSSLERPEDPFCVKPAIQSNSSSDSVRRRSTAVFNASASSNPFFSRRSAFRRKTVERSFTKKRIRKEILGAENQSVLQNLPAMEFIAENGPDTLINCVSANFRLWDKDSDNWVWNRDIDKQRKFVDAFYKRCSHSIEKPSMVDRGIQIILNSTTWEYSTHGKAYRSLLRRLGLCSTENEKEKIKMIINTCMSPWLRSQKTFERISVIIRNELYNAYGAVTDPPEQLTFVSPCSIENELKYKNWIQDGFIFGELEASFSKSRQGRQYHAVALFCVRDKDRPALLDLAKKARQSYCYSPESGQNITYVPLKFRIMPAMTVFDLMTGCGDIPNYERCESEPPGADTVDGKRKSKKKPSNRVKAYLDKYSDQNLTYPNISMPEIDVEFFYSDSLRVCAKIKLRRVIRYHHLSRDLVDEPDYPATQEYLLYSYQQHAYLSHCPNRHPDFQQLIELDVLPTPVHEGSESTNNILYKEAMRRGVIVYLPQIQTGGKPVLKRGNPDVCRDPIDHHFYNAVSWSDQGAFTGDMTSINLQFVKRGKRWFDGTNINLGFSKTDFPMLFDADGNRRFYREEEDDVEEDDIYEL